MKMYEAQTNANQKQEDIEKKQNEIDRLNKEMEKLRRRLGKQRQNDSLVSQNSINTHRNSSDTSLSARVSSIEDQVKNAVAVLTQNIASVQKSIRALSERVDGMERETIKLKIKLYPLQVYIVPFEGKELQIVVLGGEDGSNKPSSNMFRLDYYGKIWKKVSIELPKKIIDHGTVILEDELYIIGGAVDSMLACHTLYRLNKKIKWEKLADMDRGRLGITNSCISHNGCIWVIGGFNGSTYLNSIEKYDPATNRWEIKSAMKRGRGEAAAAVINDRIYVCGGFNIEGTLDSVEVFDISSEVWTDFCTLPQPRRGMSIIVDGTSIVLIGGNYMKSQKTVWKMDVEIRNREWILLPSLKEGRSYSSAVMIETGCILVFGGKINDQSSSSVEIFSGQKWEFFTPLPQPRNWHTSVVLTPTMINGFCLFALER